MQWKGRPALEVRQCTPPKNTDTPQKAGYKYCYGIGSEFRRAVRIILDHNAYLFEHSNYEKLI